MKQKITIITSTLFVFFSQALLAQVEDVQNAVAKTPEAKEIVEEISAFEFLMKGGVFLIPIGILLFYTIYLGVEKYLYIRRRVKYNENLVSNISASLNSGNLDEALQIVSKEDTAYGNMVKEGVQTIGRPVSEIEANIEKVANIEIGLMEKNLGHLGLIAGIAPTLGFIGTISGVIKIFYNISISENVSIGNISGGLYEKMISSGSGLVVGIVAYSIYHILNGLIDNFSLNAQKVNLNLINLIQRPSHGNKAK